MPTTIEELVAKLRLDNAQFIAAVKDSTSSLNDIGNKSKKAGESVDSLGKSATRSLNETKQKAKETASSMSDLEKAVSDVKKAFVIGAFVTTATIMARKGIEIADSWKLASARLSLVTTGVNEYRQAEQQLFATSQKSRSGYMETLSLYTRIARALKDTNFTQTDFLRTTESISKAMKISGASTSEAAAGMLQLSQALGSGKLQGDEFRSIMENAPRLAEAIAAGMGKPLGALKELSTEGKLTAEVIVNALASQADAIDKEFSRMPKTVGDSVTVMSNEIGKMISDFDKANGITSTLSTTIVDFSKHLDTAAKMAMVMAGAALPYVLTQIASGAMAAAVAIKALTVAMLANPVGLFAVAISTAAAAMYAFRTETDKMTSLQKVSKELKDLQVQFDALKEKRDKFSGTPFWSSSQEAIYKKMEGQIASVRQRIKEVGEAEEITAAMTETWNEANKKVGKSLQTTDKESQDFLKSLKDKALFLKEGEGALLKAKLDTLKLTDEEKKLALSLIDTITGLKEEKKELKDSTAEAERKAKAIQDYIDKIQEQHDTLGMSERALAQYNARQAGLNETQVQATMLLYDTDAAWKAMKKSADEASDAIADADKKMEEAGNTIVDSLVKEADALGKSTTELLKNDLARQGITESSEKYQKAMLANQKIESFKAAEEIEKIHKDELKKREEDEKHYLERVQDATADTFADIFQNIDDGFSGVYDKVKNYFIRMLAEMAAQAIAKPIIVPILQSIESGIGLSTGTTSIFGSSSGGMGSLFQTASTAKDLYSLGSKGYSSLSSLFSSGSASAGSMLGTSAQAAAYQSDFAAINAEMGYAADSATTFSSALQAASPYLLAYAAGSLGYTSLGAEMGLPQGQYSGIGAGIGAAGGLWAGTEAGASMGSAYGPYGAAIGAIVGAIAGGFGASFIGGDGNYHSRVLSQPELSYGGTMNFNTGGYDYTNYRNRTSSDYTGPYPGSNPYYGEAFGALEDATNEAAAGIWKQVNSLIEGFPEDVAAGIKEDLAGLSFTFNEDLSWVLKSTDFESNMTNILEQFVTEIYDGITPVIEKGFSEYAQSLITSGTQGDLFGRLSENNILKTSLKDTSFFKSDYSAAEGVSFEQYMTGVNSWLDLMGQVESVFAQVDSTVESILNPMTDFEKGIQSIKNQFDELRSALYSVGASAEEFTKITNAETEAIQNYINAAKEKMEMSLDSQIDKMTMTDYEYSKKQIEATFSETMKYIAETFGIGSDIFNALAEKAARVRDLSLAALEAEKNARDFQSKQDATTRIGDLTKNIDDAIKAFSMDEFASQTQAAKRTVADWQSQIATLVSEGNLLPEMATILLDKTQEWLKLTLDGIEKNKHAQEVALEADYRTFQMGLSGKSANDITVANIAAKRGWGDSYGTPGNFNIERLYKEQVLPFINMTFEDFKSSADLMGMTWQELSADITSLSDVFNALQVDAEALRDSWKSLAASLSDTISSLKTSDANPADVYERLAIAAREIDIATANFAGLTNDGEKQAAIENISGLWQNYLSIGQEAFARPSDEYQQIFDAAINGLSGMQSYADNIATAYDVAVQSRDYLAEIAGNTSFLAQIPSYAGGGVVEEDTLAFVHQGEIYTNDGNTPIIPVSENGSGETVIQFGDILIQGSDNPEETARIFLQRVRQELPYILSRDIASRRVISNIPRSVN